MIFFKGLSSDFLDTFLAIIALLSALFVAIPFHEFAHAYAAKKQGDYTAVAYKRCTPAALVHFDLAGFMLMIFFGFGWAKPVPVDPRNFKHGKKSEFLVSIAGIVMNLILGIVFLFIYMLIIKVDVNFFVNSYYGVLLFYFLRYSFLLNFGLAIFNLLPIYPLDGYNIIKSFCKYDNGYLRFARTYSMILFIIIIISGVYAVYYDYVIEKLLTLFINLFGKILGL